MIKLRFMKLIAVFTLLLVLVSGLSGCGQSPVSTDVKQGEESLVAKVTLYDGSDRTERLMEGVKKEGGLNFYTSMAEKTTEKIVAEFEKKYGIKVNVWRAGSSEILQKVTTEWRAGKFDFDAVLTTTPEMEALHREKMLQEVKSPYLKDLIPETIPTHKEWAATYLVAYVQAYNTKLVNKDALPKTYEDLFNPKWKGNLGIEATDWDWVYSVVKQMGEEKGIKFWQELVAKNGVSVRQGHSLLNNLVVSGEVPLALTVYSYAPEQSKRKGAAIDWFAIEPVITRANAVGISKKAPHPNAATVFYDYLITDGQQILKDLDNVPTTTKLESPLKNMKVTLIDPVDTLDQMEKWSKVFDDIFVTKK